MRVEFVLVTPAQAAAVLRQHSKHRCRPLRESFIQLLLRSRGAAPRQAHTLETQVRILPPQSIRCRSIGRTPGPDPGDEGSIPSAGISLLRRGICSSETR